MTKLDADMLVLFCGGSFICEIFLFHFFSFHLDSGYLWITKMVKLLACFIDVTGKYYFHFMHDMRPHPLGLRKIDGLQGFSVHSSKLT